jgi:hypothetical protein
MSLSSDLKFALKSVKKGNYYKTILLSIRNPHVFGYLFKYLYFSTGKNRPEAGQRHPLPPGAKGVTGSDPEAKTPPHIASAADQ